MEVQPPLENAVTEQYILNVLASKHTRDIFVPHCKTGPSYGFSNHCVCGRKYPSFGFILDAWVMPYSWTKPIIGYEVKVSRNDFRRDRKWMGYLQYCNLFYFVCPWGLIGLGQVPEEAGLIYLTKTGVGIRYMKRAPSRWWHTIPQGIFQYVLMWRADRLREVEER